MKGDPLSTHYHSTDTRRTRPTRKAQNLKRIQQTASAAPSKSGTLLVCPSCSIVHFKVKGCINAFSIRFYLLLRFITFNYVYDCVCRGMSTCCRRPVCEGQERVSNPLSWSFRCEAPGEEQNCGLCQSSALNGRTVCCTSFYFKTQSKWHCPDIRLI